MVSSGLQILEDDFPFPGALKAPRGQEVLEGVVQVLQFMARDFETQFHMPSKKICCKKTIWVVLGCHWLAANRRRKNQEKQSQ